MGFLEERDLSSVPSIPEFYRGKTIFVTGGTGFMGKVLIEKLLYSCSELDKIYLLMRSKKGVTPEDRLAQIYSRVCFDRLRKEKPTLFKSKIFAINGDVMDPGLGLSVEDRALLVNRVDILFHAAASVRFDDPLRSAVQLNLKGTVQVMELAKEMKNLCSMIHISTSYCNTNRQTIDEVLYPPLADWRDMINICDALDDHTLNVLTSKYMGELPNTYTFTKHLAEHVVYEDKGRVPAVIVRPAIVISSIEEPIPGYIENFNGPAGIMAAIAKGILRTLFSRTEVKYDYIPVDVSIRSIIAAAWMRGTKSLEPTDDIPVYHSCMDADDRYTMQETIDMGLRLTKEVASDNALWYPQITTTTSPTLYTLQILLLHLLPAIFVDTLLRMMGKKPMLVKIQRRIYTANLALRYFMTKDWTFVNTNLVQLRSCIKDEDHAHFYFTLTFPNKYQFYATSAMSARKYLFKEKDEDIPKAIRHYNRMWVLDKIMKIVFYGYLIKYIINFVANNITPAILSLRTY